MAFDSKDRLSAVARAADDFVRRFAQRNRSMQKLYISARSLELELLVRTFALWVFPRHTTVYQRCTAWALQPHTEEPNYHVYIRDVDLGLVMRAR